MGTKTVRIISAIAAVIWIAITVEYLVAEHTVDLAALYAMGFVVAYHAKDALFYDLTTGKDSAK